MCPNDPFDEFDKEDQESPKKTWDLTGDAAEKEKKQRSDAFGALDTFLDDYEPAENSESATTLLSTKEIANAIYQLTGVTLPMYDIYEVMKNMGFKYSTINVTEFQWNLNKAASKDSKS